MAIEDRHHAFIVGIIAGVPSHEVDSEKVLYASDAPYKFRDQLLPRRLLAHHDWTDWNSPARVVRRDTRGKLAYKWQSREAFADWMTATLDAALMDERGPEEWKATPPRHTSPRCALAWRQPERRLPTPPGRMRSRSGWRRGAVC